MQQVEFGGFIDTIEYLGQTFDSRHGGAFDRGSADSWYDRGIQPHYYVGSPYMSERVGILSMTQEEVAAYLAGYQYNEEFGSKKDYD